MKNNIRTDLVSHIAGFTSIRDADLLELSLLKSIYTALRPNNVSLIQLDTDNLVIKRIDYSATQFGNVTLHTPANAGLIEASEQLDRGTKEYCTVILDTRCLTLFLLSQNRRVTQYVCIESNGDIVTQADSLQIIGMLRIFKNFRALLRESQTDELTGLPNRKYFNSVFDKLNETLLLPPEKVNDDRRHKAKQAQKYWLALVDLDDFKRINDNFGHLMGDEVLVRVAQTMQSSVREGDMVFRYGGEEFAVIINTDKEEDVSIILERMRLNIAQIEIGNIGKVTVSVGVVEIKEHVFALTLLENADEALYESKAKGKNTITFVTSISTIAIETDESDIELF